MRAQVETKAAVSVAAMSRMVGLSRSRFYELVEAGVFPPPVYDVQTRRPLYTEDQQKACLEVRRRNCGANGRPVLFYSRGTAAPAVRPRPAAARPAPDPHADLLAGVKALGLTTATAADVRTAVREVYPAGTAGRDPGEVLRAVFLALKRRDSGDKPGR